MSGFTTSYNSKEYRTVGRLLEEIDRRSFNKEVFVSGLIDMGGKSTSAIIDIVSMYIDNMVIKAKTLEISELDEETLNSIDWILRLGEVLTTARNDGKL